MLDVAKVGYLEGRIPPTRVTKVSIFLPSFILFNALYWGTSSGISLSSKFLKLPLECDCKDGVPKAAMSGVYTSHQSYGLILGYSLFPSWVFVNFVEAVSRLPRKRLLPPQDGETFDTFEEGQQRYLRHSLAAGYQTVGGQGSTALRKNIWYKHHKDETANCVSYLRRWWKITKVRWSLLVNVRTLEYRINHALGGNIWYRTQTLVKLAKR
jgi:hypothetical protein